MADEVFTSPRPWAQLCFRCFPNLVPTLFAKILLKFDVMEATCGGTMDPIHLMVRVQRIYLKDSHP